MKRAAIEIIRIVGAVQPDLMILAGMLFCIVFGGQL